MYKKQQGMTMISWAVVVSFIGVILVAALNIIPSYLNYFSAKSVMNRLAEDSAIKGKSAKDISSLIHKRFKSNNLGNIKVKDAIHFKNKGAQQGSGYTVTLKYEDRGVIMGNLYFVTAFEYEVEMNP